MPVEIKELIVEAKLHENPQHADRELLTDEDEQRIVEEIFARLRSESTMTPGERRELIAEMKRELKALLEEQWRK